MAYPSREWLILTPDDPRWLDLVQTHPHANTFHHPAWMQLMSQSYGYRSFVVAVGDPDGSLDAGLPMMVVRSALTGRRWVSLPFADHCRPLATGTDAVEELGHQIMSYFRTSRLRGIELRWGFSESVRGEAQSRYVLHELQLDRDADAVMSRFGRMHRQNIHAAQKRGVRIEWGETTEDLRQYYRLQLMTRHRLGVPAQPWKFFARLGELVLAQKLGFLLLAYSEEECIAGAIFLNWQTTLMAKYAASRQDMLNLRPNNLLFWTAIRWGCENGYTVFDMGRTDVENTGLRKFKSYWGAEETPLVYSTMGEIPTQTSDGRVMQIMQSIIRRSPEWVCKVTGELLYRHVG